MMVGGKCCSRLITLNVEMTYLVACWYGMQALGTVSGMVVSWGVSLVTDETVSLWGLLLYRSMDLIMCYFV